MSIEPNLSSLEPIVSLCKRRGFIFPSSEIYGGLGSCYDYGPLGIELKRNIKESWWKSMVHRREDIVGLDSSIIMHPKVWEASGHVSNFTDPLVECSLCQVRLRADQLDEQTPKCTKAKDGKHAFGEPRNFNLMFKTHLGPAEDSGSTVYLRPETAQGIFVNFANVCDSTRVKIPFGIAQQGKSFRNEISTRRFIFRMSEFEQMEMEYFIEPGSDEQWFSYWRNERMNWWKALGVTPERLRLRDHDKDELSHYSTGTSDVEYLFPFGWSEVEGIACRGNFDLTQHSTHSGKQILWRDQVNNKTYIPHVIEPAAGTDRIFAVVLCDSYFEESVDGNERVVLKLHPKLAPIKVAVFPLLRKDGHPEKALEIYKELQEHYYCQYDDGGTIGKRYRRQDEAGTPLCLTVDHQTFEDQTVTLRDRDSLAQDRVNISEIRQQLIKRLGF